jgi:hypothetical protein
VLLYLGRYIRQEGELSVIRFGVGLGDLCTLILQKTPKRFRFGLTHRNQLFDRLRFLRLCASLELRLQISSVVGCPLADPFDHMRGWGSDTRNAKIIQG